MGVSLQESVKIMFKKVTSKLLKRRQAVAFLAGTILICPCLSSTGWTMRLPASLQDDDAQASSQPSSDAIKTVEASGGRVYRISAADATREVSFNLASKPVGDDQLKGVNAIADVIWINLAGTNVTNDGLKYLAKMPLKKLHLERTKIEDAGLQHLKSFKDLEYLNVYDTKITDAGLEHLKGLKNLKKLYVWKTAVTEAGMKKLNESLPDLEIVGELKLQPVVVEAPKKEEPKKDAPAKTEDKTKAQPKKKNRKEKAAARKKAAEQKKKKSDATDKQKAKSDSGKKDNS